jgi:hypothetical protein
MAALLVAAEVSVAAGAAAVSAFITVVVSADVAAESVAFVFEELLLHAAIKHAAEKMQNNFFMVFVLVIQNYNKYF